MQLKQSLNGKTSKFLLVFRRLGPGYLNMVDYSPQPLPVQNENQRNSSYSKTTSSILAPKLLNYIALRFATMYK